MNMQFDYVPTFDRTDPRDMSRPWGRLTAKTNGGTSVLTASLWPDGAHVIKITHAHTANLGAVVTASELAEFARAVESTAKGCARCDATELQGIELAAKAERIRAGAAARIRASAAKLDAAVMGLEA